MDFVITTSNQFYFNAGSALLLLPRWGWHVSLEEAREKKSVTRLGLSAGYDIKRRVPPHHLSLPAVPQSVPRTLSRRYSYVGRDVSCWSLSRHLICSLVSRAFSVVVGLGLGEVLFERIPHLSLLVLNARSGFFHIKSTEGR